MSAPFIPSEPRCRCGAAVAWVAWLTNDERRMSELWFACQGCSARLPRLRHDHEARHFYGSKRAFFMLEDIVDTYRPPPELALQLVTFCSWAARQPPTREWWLAEVVGADPETFEKEVL